MVRRGVASTSVTALDAPREVDPGEWANWTAGGIGILALVVVGIFFGSADVGDAQPLATGMALAASMACLATAYVVYSHAAASRNRAYLALGSTYLAAAWCSALIPVVTDGGFVSDSRLIGGPQSEPWASILLHFLLVVGVASTAGILWSDGRRHRRAGRSTHVRATAVCSLTVVAVASVWIITGWPGIPEVVDAQGAATTLGLVVVAVIALLALLALAVVLALGIARYSIVAGWLIGVTLIALGQALVDLSRPAADTVGWLVSRFLGLAALILIPMLMLSHLGRVERVASRRAGQDRLTGLASRDGLLAGLDHELGRAHALSTVGALLWIDLDGFKSINDQLGHAAGDSALRQVAARLRQAARPSDIVARLAGDEFGILVVDIRSIEDAESIARRALTLLAEPIHIDTADAILTASIGIAHFPGSSADADELLHQADLAMYAAKRDGGDQFSVYDGSMGQEAVQMAVARQQLARALRDGTFELHYQPMVDLRSGSAIGVEALVRWRRDDVLISAGDFIPMAESTGQIRSVGRMVLDLLAADLGRSGGDLPPAFRVSVNLSVPELADPAVAAVFCDGALTPHLGRITVEVTEGVMLSDHARAVQHIGLLRAAGAVIALDDFGSGFANVEALASLQPEVIKVDAAFTRRAGRGDPSGLAFLRAALAIGDAIGARVLAEGIETSGELATVRGLGIELGQGTYFGAPAAGLHA